MKYDPDALPFWASPPTTREARERLLVQLRSRPSRRNMQRELSIMKDWLADLTDLKGWELRALGYAAPKVRRLRGQWRREEKHKTRERIRMLKSILAPTYPAEDKPATTPCRDVYIKTYATYDRGRDGNGNRRVPKKYVPWA